MLPTTRPKPRYPSEADDDLRHVQLRRHSGWYPVLHGSEQFDVREVGAFFQNPSISNIDPANLAIGDRHPVSAQDLPGNVLEPGRPQI